MNLHELLLVTEEEAAALFDEHMRAVEARRQARAKTVECEPCRAGGPVSGCVRPCARPSTLRQERPA